MNRRGFFLSAIILFFFVTLISVNYFVENHGTNPYMAIKKPIEFYGAKYEDILKKNPLLFMYFLLTFWDILLITFYNFQEIPPLTL